MYLCARECACLFACVYACVLEFVSVCLCVRACLVGLVRAREHFFTPVRCKWVRLYVCARVFALDNESAKIRQCTRCHLKDAHDHLRFRHCRHRRLIGMVVRLFVFFFVVRGREREEREREREREKWSGEQRDPGGRGSKGARAQASGAGQRARGVCARERA